ncbi:MAG: hypothetical protein AB1758_34735, partial [Candidatus Eremiobacterota bacterium]
MKRASLALILCFCVWALPALARPGTFAGLIRDLVHQFEARGVPASRKEKSCWLEAYGVVRQLGLKPFLEEPGLNALDLDKALASLGPDLAPEFSELTPSHAVDMYTRVDGNPDRF